MTRIPDVRRDFPAESSGGGGCSSHHSQGAGAYVAAPLHAAQLVISRTTLALYMRMRIESYSSYSAKLLSYFIFRHSEITNYKVQTAFVHGSGIQPLDLMHANY